MPNLNVKLAATDFEQQLRALIVAVKTSLDRENISPLTRKTLEGKYEAYVAALKLFEAKFKPVKHEQETSS